LLLSKPGHVISFLFALLIVLVIGAMPLWPYSRTWGYYPTGLIAVTLSVLILLAISGRLG
jgi:low affinity Fe/Cu permease